MYYYIKEDKWYSTRTGEMTSQSVTVSVFYDESDAVNYAADNDPKYDRFEESEYTKVERGEKHTKYTLYYNTPKNPSTHKKLFAEHNLYLSDTNPLENLL